MKVNLQAVNFNVDRKLVDFVQEKLDKLEKYYDKIVSSDVFLKVENTSDKENKTVDNGLDKNLVENTNKIKQEYILLNIEPRASFQLKCDALIFGKLSVV